MTTTAHPAGAASEAPLSPQRAILAARLASKAKANTHAAAIAAADRKLDGHRKEAEQLAADVAACNGGVPSAELAIALVTANARVASAGPVREKLAADMLVAGQGVVAAIAASQEQITCVLHEELTFLEEEIAALNARLLPLQLRLAGLRLWAMNQAHTGSEAHQVRHNRLMTAAMTAIGQLCPYALNATGGTEAQWDDLAERLMADADARLAC